MPQSERIVEFRTEILLFIRGGQTVIEGNILPAELITDIWVPWGFSRNLLQHLDNCQVNVPKQEMKTKSRNAFTSEYGGSCRDIVCYATDLNKKEVWKVCSKEEVLVNLSY